MTVSVARPPFLVGEWWAEPDTDRIRRGDEAAKLEPKVMAVLCYLAERPGQVVTREDLERDVWAGTVVGYDALTSTIIKLRKALQDDSRKPHYIETLPKKGYRLIASVGPANPGSAVESAAVPPRPTGSKHWPVIAGLIGMVALVVMLLSMFEEKPPEYISTRSVASIVVLPFNSLGSAPENDYFSDGITEDLTTDLSRMTKLLVISRRSAFIYKGQEVDVRKVGEQLNVDYVLQGTIRKSGNRVRVNTELVDAKTGFEIWAQRYDHTLDDIFNLQDTLRKKIISALSIVLSEQQQADIARSYTRSIVAYDSFLRGQSFLVKQTRADNLLARKHFQDAVAHDVSFARAHSGLALTHVNDYRFNWNDDPKKSARLAVQLAQEAIRLDSHSPQAHWVSGIVHLFVEGDHARAIEMGIRTMQIEPNSADGLILLAAIYLYDGQPEKSRILVEKAKRLNPYYSSQYPSVLGLSYLLMEDYAKAIDAYKDSLEINSGRLQPNIYIIVSYLRAGMKEEAKWQLDQFRINFPQFKLAEWIARQPYKDRAVLQGVVEDLRLVGMK